ncbi:von Willebrand factor type A domain-containing protein [Candidatus Omnitrophota bacterium]
MFRHSKIKKLLSSYYDGECTPQEAEMVEEHLNVCAECKERMQHLQRTSDHLREWKDHEVTPDLEQNIRKNFLGGGIKMKTHAIRKRVAIAGGISSIIVLLAFTFIFINKMTPEIKGPLKQRSTNNNIMTGAKSVTPQTSESTVAYKRIAQTAQYYGASTRAMGQYDASVAYDTGAGWGASPEYGGASPEEEYDTEAYDRIYEGGFLRAKDNPLSTFSIDVDTAAYANIRRFLNNEKLPPKDAVRIEEMINYFSYDYPQPTGSDPVTITTEISDCPWNPSHKLVQIGIQAKKIKTGDLPASNLVFLIDVSGSMGYPDKLPLLKKAFKMLVEQMRAQDTVSIVVYAGAAGLVLDAAKGDEQMKILEALENLEAGGSTAGGEGIKLAYEVAKKNFITGGNNRVILATDGDFNVGSSSDAEMTRLIEEKRDDGIFLTVVGFGMGNYKDSKMENLADKGNGNAAYIDGLLEAKKVFISELGATLFTVAKDVKVQVEFNPGKVEAYRLIGYEDRMLNKEDFNDDKKDAGELGSGHTVTVLYEVALAGSAEEFPEADPLKYQKTAVVKSTDLMTVKMRYKDPDGTESKLITQSVLAGKENKTPSENFRFASSVAEFGLLLRDSEYKGDAFYKSTIERAKAAKGEDPNGYRAEFIKLVEIAEILSK